MMRALSVKQPWAWAIFNAQKDVENRNWRNKYCSGKIAIHVSKQIDRKAVLPHGVREPRPEELVTGKIVGLVELVDVVTRHRSKWSNDNFKLHWVLRNARALPEPIKCKGALRLWEVPPQIAGEIERQLPR